MVNIKTYDEFNSENEGIKTWGAGIMAGLSLFANSVMGGDIKTKGTGKSMDMEMAIKKAQSDAKMKVGGSNSATMIKGGTFGEPQINKDKDGNYIVTIEYSVDSSGVSSKPIVKSETMDGMKTKYFMGDIVGLGYRSEKNVMTSSELEKFINDFIDKYSNEYNFKISKMTKEDSDNVGEMSIKLFKTFKDGKIVYCVVTPIGK